jgi:hypothetical protein
LSEKNLDNIIHVDIEDLGFSSNLLYVLELRNFDKPLILSLNKKAFMVV